MQVPLNPTGGRALQVRARMADEDVHRLSRLAAQRGQKPSRVMRELIRAGLDAAERATGPPDDG